MDINSTTPSVATTAKTAAKPETETETADKTSAAGPGGDFETFLTLLTTQLKNQDPLKPMESTEFVAQLASFSAVEQQVRANDKLDEIYSVLARGNADGLAQWIGKEVRAPGKGSFEGVPLEVEVTPNTEADRAMLVVRNDFDQVVARKEVSVTAREVTWDGTNDLGQTAPNGAYAFSVENFAGETLLGTEPGRVFSAVNEVRLVDGLPVLVLAGGEQVPVEDITGVR